MPDHMVSLSGYCLLRNDRVGRIGDGVAIYMTNNLHGSILRHSGSDHNGRPEYLIAKITINNNSKILIAVVYRPPYSGYLSEFFEVFTDLLVSYRHSIIFGDFNADLGLDI